MAAETSGAGENPARPNHATATDSCGITVQVIFAQGPDEVWAVEMQMGPDATLGQAIDRSGFAQQFPDYDMADLKAGIFGQRCSRDHPLSEGDRVEIYRPLDFDPMESRRRRAQHRKSRLSRT